MTVAEVLPYVEQHLRRHARLGAVRATPTTCRSEPAGRCVVPTLEAGRACPAGADARAGTTG